MDSLKIVDIPNINIIKLVNWYSSYYDISGIIKKLPQTIKNLIDKNEIENIY